VSAAPQLPPAWHALAHDNVLERVDGAQAGLSAEEAQRRLARYGPNRIKPAQRRPAWRRFLLQFHNVLIYLLLVAALVTAMLGHVVDTAVILGVVVINALIGFLQEGKAEQALRAIGNMLSLHAMVLRHGQRHEISADELVPGDVVLLQSGDKVPADLRLLQVKGLRVDEAILTGESEAVDKDIAPVSDNAALGDRLCMAYSGTMVTYGQGHGVVVATGERTEIGRISTLVSQVQQLPTPLLRQIAAFGRFLSIAILLLAAATFLFGWLVRDHSPDELFMAIVGLAVAAIPEGLPAILTITLAIGVQRMARRNAIIRHLPAVETLGSVNVICSDKTGTLTRNEMTVRTVVTADRRFSVSGVGYAPDGGFMTDGKKVLAEDFPLLQDIMLVGLLCNDAVVRETREGWKLEGDPTEGALYTLALKAAADVPRIHTEYPRTDAIPFESAHRFMATLHHDHNGHGFIFLKGAPESVTAFCACERSESGDQPFDAERWRREAEAIAGQGQRVLALALRPVPESQQTLEFSDARDGFILLGLLGIIDPPSEEAIAAVRKCQQAGIRVKMITGDHAATARAVAAQLGLAAGRVLTGVELARLSDKELEKQAADVDVFARASPEDKLRLVQALQARGYVVAMTGDGVNDAPALKRADVGVAMGIKGTEVTKEVAEMVLADDNFASIAHAVEEGRTVHDNLRKAILFILPTNAAQAGVIVLAILAGIMLPITPAQILWVNMVTAVTLSLAFAFEPADNDVMRRPPRAPGSPILSGVLIARIAFAALLLTVAVSMLFLWEIKRGRSIEEGRTIAVNMLVAAEMLYLFNSRHLSAASFGRAAFFGNRYALLAIALLIAAQLGFTYLPPMQRLFGTTALDIAAWWRIIALAAVIFLLIELEKSLWRRRRTAIA
jgi:magnesium-transporting ATPase (P-type)